MEREKLHDRKETRRNIILREDNYAFSGVLFSRRQNKLNEKEVKT